jgi:hypothetical protein
MQKIPIKGLLWESARYIFAKNCKNIHFRGKAPQTPSKKRLFKVLYLEKGPNIPLVTLFRNKKVV